MSIIKKVLSPVIIFVFAVGLWLPTVHLFFRPVRASCQTDDGISPLAQELAARHLALWSDPQLRAAEVARMRQRNAEWDFMARTFFVLSLVNMAYHDPVNQDEYLEIVDVVIDETLRLEQEYGKFYFLLPYGKARPFVSQAGRSLFQDGEIALMLAARRMAQERLDYQPLLVARVNDMVAQMSESPVLSGESYPDESWIFCNTTALAAIRMSDVLDGSDHTDFLERWVATAKNHLIDSQTGLLVSSYTFDGTALDGPEGSSIWMAAHNLKIVDPLFAADQYQRAKMQLAGNVFGFGYAREWPVTWVGHPDIDSGPVIPILKMSAGSSGLAFIGAGAFDDERYLTALLTSLEFGAFPIRKQGQLYYAASNSVGDAVMLYALVQGPLWDAVLQSVGGGL